MSHFSTVKTELRDRESLLAALRDLGQEPSSGEQPVRGYRGQTVTADLCCPQSEGGDIGFRWNSAEQRYELVTDLDLWKQSVPVERFLAQLTQRYALQSILRSSAEEGYQVAEQRQQADGSIELVVTRWQGGAASILHWLFAQSLPQRQRLLPMAWSLCSGVPCVRKRCGWMKSFALVAATAPMWRATPSWWSRTTDAPA